MNETCSKLEIIGDATEQKLLRAQLFRYYDKDHVCDVMEIERSDPDREYNHDYAEYLIQRWSDEKGGYYYFRKDVWADVFGEEANVDLYIVNERQQQVFIEARSGVSMKGLQRISARYPHLTFYYLHDTMPQLIEWSAVIVDGEVPPVSGQNVRLSENERGKEWTSCDHDIHDVTRS